MQLAELRAAEALRLMEERPSTTQFSKFSTDTIQEISDLEVVLPTVKSGASYRPYVTLCDPNVTILPGAYPVDSNE